MIEAEGELGPQHSWNKKPVTIQRRQAKKGDTGIPVWGPAGSKQLAATQTVAAPNVYLLLLEKLNHAGIVAVGALYIYGATKAPAVLRENILAFDCELANNLDPFDGMQIGSFY